MAVPSVLVFGALSPCPSPEWQHHLKAALRQDTRFRPMVTAINGLPDLWTALSENTSLWRPTSWPSAARTLVDWLEHTQTQLVDERRNAVLLPLSIITHITQYLTYLAVSDEHIDQHAVLRSTRTAGGIQGLCAGLLSAVSVASAKSAEEVITYAAYAIELAFCIGVYIDVDHEDSNAISLAIRWPDTTGTDQVEKLIAAVDGAYISVTRDIRDATLVCPQTEASRLTALLSSQGLTVVDIGLNGRYHCKTQNDVPDNIIRTCRRRRYRSFRPSGLVRSNSTAEVLPDDNADLLVVRSIVEDRAQWYATLNTATRGMHGNKPPALAVAFGSDAIPHTTSKIVKTQRMSTNSIEIKTLLPLSIAQPIDLTAGQPHGRYPDNAIAVIGMGCKFPGANNLADFWNILSEGTSMLAQAPMERFSHDDLPRAKDDMRFWGNFVDDIDAWDHKFFKKSPREAASMDPQQRHLLQVTYHALESSGYFSDDTNPRDIGCYLGACSTDYDFNIASHPPTAYSTLGSLRAFLSGRISHYFGWSGPSLTFDTACSASAVAIHTACRALQARECSQAIAGGATLITSPYLYENLHAAHFLSRTGATKPFDASADGYCRGEGIGVVVLKRLDDAIAAGDHIRGVIIGSGVSQNNNSVPITVPHAPSQASLYTKVAKDAGVELRDINFVEAHGTGTPVGDPIEMESIQSVFGASSGRSEPLFVSSVKGNIGHLEGASGVAALIKTLLQMQHRQIVPQASFQRLNPKIPALEPHQVVIPTAVQKLPRSRLTACINNYGAAGSNATLLVAGGPQNGSVQRMHRLTSLRKLPIKITAASIDSLLARCRTLETYCKSITGGSQPDQQGIHFEDLAYSLARRQNADLSHNIILAASDTSDLCTRLQQQTASYNTIHERQDAPPVVLCFGGQGADAIALNENVYNQNTVLKSNLDDCDEQLRQLGYPGIYPYIFQSETITDVIVLHTVIFAMQYAAAKSWIDCGLKVETVIGHSLGQLTALTVAGSLSLRDGLKFVAGRADLMVKYWGVERGTMVVLDAEVEAVSELTDGITARDPACRYEVACYNGPRCQVIVSDTASALVLEDEARKRSMRYKRLSLEYGFHSRFTEDLYPQLEELAESLNIKQPRIHVETCSFDQAWPKITSKLIADHTRDPVHFTAAVQRTHARLRACTWLEAGSNSTVIGLAARIVGTATTGNKFLAVALNKTTSLDTLTDLAVELWKRGHKLTYWGFHRSQHESYQTLDLPPYPFEKHRHWLELVTPTAAEPSTQSSSPLQVVREPPTMLRLNRYDSQEQVYYFDINADSEEFRTLVEGHSVRGTAMCPPSIYVEFAARAIKLAVGVDEMRLVLEIEDLWILAALPLKNEGSIHFTLKPTADAWVFEVVVQPEHALAVTHVKGLVSMRTANRALDREFARFERLAGREIITTVLDAPSAEIISGSMVYKMLSSVVEYADFYRGVQLVAADKGKVVGKVRPPPALAQHLGKTTTVHPAVLNYFTQVVGIHANFMANPGTHLLKMASIDRICIGHAFEDLTADSINDTLYELVAIAENGRSSYDVFVYDAVTQKLVALLLGVYFAVHEGSHTPAMEAPRVSKSARQASEREIPQQRPGPSRSRPSHRKAPSTTRLRPADPQPVKETSNDPRDVVLSKVCQLFAQLADVPVHNVVGSTTFEVLGIDSLTMIEAVSELSSIFKMDIPIEDMMVVPDIDTMVDYIHGHGTENPREEATSSDAGESSGSSVRSSSSYEARSVTTMSTAPSLHASKAVANVRPDAVVVLKDLVMKLLETQREPQLSDGLVDLGFDSLLVIELLGDVQRKLRIEVDIDQLDEESTYGDLVRLVSNGGSFDATTTVKDEPTRSQPSSQTMVAQSFNDVHFRFDKIAQVTGFDGFWKNVYPYQKDIVLSYVLEAFARLGCDLAQLRAGAAVLPIETLPRHRPLLERMHNILADGGLLKIQADGGYIRTETSVRITSSVDLFEQMLRKFPAHASETKLLNVTASRLADCLTGAADPLRLLFANEENKANLADVYDTAPMCQTTTRLLAEFLSKAYAGPRKEPLRIIEVGAGTGGTARYLLKHLREAGIEFEYTFTDISFGLIAAAKRKFKDIPELKFATYDCNRPPPPEMKGRYQVAIATNCIHATTHARTSVANVASLLDPDGVFCLVEFTRSLYWFDLVYGLLEGWWLFADGRRHALADETFWARTLRDAGFAAVDWTDGSSEEAKTIRLIRGLKRM